MVTNNKKEKMKISEKFAYASLIGLIFLIFHFIMAYCKLNAMTNLVITLSLMLTAQLTAFAILKKKLSDNELQFKNIFGMLCLTQCMEIIFLTINAAINPLEGHTSIDPIEVTMSLIIFGGGFSLLTTTVIWFSALRKKAKNS